MQIDNKTKREYNKYIVKNDKNKKATKQHKTKKPHNVRKKVAKAAEWGKQWEKVKRQVSW